MAEDTQERLLTSLAQTCTLGGLEYAASRGLSYTCCPVGWEENLPKFVSRIRPQSLVPILKFWVRSGR